MDSGSEAPGPGRSDTEALLRRIEALEERLRTSEPLVTNANVAPAAVRDDRGGTTERRAAELMGPLVRMSLPGYLSLTLTQAEEAVVLRDVALQAGDEEAAREQEERAAGLACVGLTRAADEFDMPEMPPDVGQDAFLRGEIDFLPAQYPDLPGMILHRFQEIETHILRIAGLSNDLAAKHLDAAFTAFRSIPETRIRSAEDVRTELSRSADAACVVRGALAQERQKDRSRRRRRANVRRCLLALGGATIAVANPLALPFIGPFAVAASAALGGGAAGAVANLIEA